MRKFYLFCFFFFFFTDRIMGLFVSKIGTNLCNKKNSTSFNFYLKETETVWFFFCYFIGVVAAHCLTFSVCCRCLKQLLYVGKTNINSCKKLLVVFVVRLLLSSNVVFTTTLRGFFFLSNFLNIWRKSHSSFLRLIFLLFLSCPVPPSLHSICWLIRLSVMTNKVQASTEEDRQGRKQERKKLNK